MAESVFILGAGASVDAGAPTMKNFLSEARKLHKERAFGPDSDDIDLLFRALNELQSKVARIRFDVENVESVLGALEMANLLQRFGNYDPDTITQIHGALVKLIVRTLELRMEFKRDSDKRLVSSFSYRNLVGLLERLGTDKTAVITFNYDIALDFAFVNEEVNYDYYLTNLAHHGVPLLKLHGSTNWAVCQKCRQIFPYDIKRFLHERKYTPLGRRTDENNTLFEVSKFLKSCCPTDPNCTHEPRILPFIIPPTWMKTGYHSDLTTIWQQAADELLEAEYIYIIGYSLPETDAFFKYLFALGVTGMSHIESVMVFDPDESKVKPRYDQLMGPVLENVIEFRPIYFEKVIDEIADRRGVNMHRAPISLL